MKLFLTSSVALLALSQADAADAGSRFLRRHSGGGKKGRLQKMINKTCPDFDCGGVDVDGLDCTLEKPARPDVSGLNEDEIAEVKREFVAYKEERREQMLECACCANMSVKEIFASARPDDSASISSGEGPSSISGESLDEDGTGDSSGESSGDTSDVDGPGAGGGGKKGRIQKMINKTCPEFDCGGVDVDSLDCTFEKPTRPDTSGLDKEEVARLKGEFMAKKEARRERMLECACCANISAKDIFAATKPDDSISSISGDGPSSISGESLDEDSSEDSSDDSSGDTSDVDGSGAGGPRK